MELDRKKKTVNKIYKVYLGGASWDTGFDVCGVVYMVTVQTYNHVDFSGYYNLCCKYLGGS